MPAQTIDIKLKCPTRVSYEPTFSISPCLTIKEFKQLVQNQYDGNPSANEQKLIYKGKLLSDSLTMEAALAVSPTELHDAPIVVHLVIKSSETKPTTIPTPTSPLPSLSSSIPTTRAHPTASHPLTSTSTLTLPQTLPNTYPSLPYQVITINGQAYLMLIPHNHTLPLPFQNQSSLAITTPLPHDYIAPLEFHLPADQQQPQQDTFQHHQQPNQTQLEQENQLPHQQQPLRNQLPPVQQEPQAVRNQPPLVVPEIRGEEEEEGEAHPLMFLLRLVFLVYIFSQGGGMKKVWEMSAIATIVFLYQMGLFSWFLRVINGLRDRNVVTHPQVPVPTQPLVEEHGNENVQRINTRLPAQQGQDGARFMSHAFLTFFVSLFYAPHELVVN